MNGRARVYGGVFLIGFGALIAQVVVVREMVVVFHGNELSIGVMLGSWLLWTGLGSMGLGALAPRLRPPRLWLAGTLLAAALALAGTVTAARCLNLFAEQPWRAFTELPSLLVRPAAVLGRLAEARESPLGQVRPFRLMLGASLILLAPFCLLNGFLFPMGCRAAGAEEAREEAGVGRVYLAEAAGAGIGGACYSFLLVHWVNPLTFAVLLAALWCLAAAVLAAGYWRRATAGKVLAGTAVVGLLVAASVGVCGWPAWLAGRIDAAYWEPLRLMSAVDSRFGRVAVVGPQRESPQRSLFHNGALAFSYPDPPAAEAAAHLPMLQHPGPRRVLLLGSGLDGALEEILKHPSVEKVTYVELDPMVVEAARREFAPGASRPLADPRVDLIVGDARAFLKRTDQRFDVVIQAEGPPSTAQVNRFYTREFFREAAAALAPGGVVAFRATGGENYIPDENRRLLASLYRTAASVFPHLVVFPGATCTFLASDRATLAGHRLDILEERLLVRGVATSYVDVAQWDAALVGGRLEEVQEAVASEAPLNRDLAPRCYYLEALRWSAEQRARRPDAQPPRVDLGTLLAVLERRPWVAIVAALGLLALASLPGPLLRRRWRDGVLGFAVCSTGFVEIAVEFVVLLGFQVAYGYVYQYVGILVASFMVGLAAGAWLSTRWVGQGRATWRRLCGVQTYICVYPLVLLGLLLLAVRTPLGATPAFAGISFTAVALAAGWVGGMQFPLAAALHSRRGASAGRLYAVDLFGACVGALAVSAVLVPLFGLVSACGLLAALGGLGLAGVAASARGRQGKSV